MSIMRLLDVDEEKDVSFFAKEERNALTELAQSIQKELEDAGGPAWSISILRAANFICDKISSASNAVQPVSNLPFSSSIPSNLERSHSFQRPVRPTRPVLHKTNSFNGLGMIKFEQHTVY